MLCPFKMANPKNTEMRISSKCSETSCAWFDEETGKCAVALIAININRKEDTND